MNCPINYTKLQRKIKKNSQNITLELWSKVKQVKQVKAFTCKLVEGVQRMKFLSKGKIYKMKEKDKKHDKAQYIQTIKKILF